MAFTASPKQMELLRQAVDDYCRDRGIVHTEERLHVAELVSTMFDLGFTSIADLRRGLEHSNGPSRRVYLNQPNDQADHNSGYDSAE